MFFSWCGSFVDVVVEVSIAGLTVVQVAKLSILQFDHFCPLLHHRVLLPVVSAVENSSGHSMLPMRWAENRMRTCCWSIRLERAIAFRVKLPNLHVVGRMVAWAKRDLFLEWGWFVEWFKEAE